MAGVGVGVSVDMGALAAGHGWRGMYPSWIKSDETTRKPARTDTEEGGRSETGQVSGEASRTPRVRVGRWRGFEAVLEPCSGEGCFAQVDGKRGRHGEEA
ncbi:hypothetical protein VCV18_005681 [Metarhizium anisopliae]